MNKSIFLLSFLLILIACRQNTSDPGQSTSSETKTLQTKSLDENSLQLPTSIQDLNYPLQTRPLISAHRGGKHIDNYPENCLVTFQYISQDYDFIIECDVAQTQDGKLILMHDNSLERTTTGTGQVKQRDWSYIQSLQLKDHQDKLTDYKVPDFGSVLKWARGNAYLSVDIKRGVNLEQLVKLLDQYEAHHFCELITYQLDAAINLHRLAPKYKLSVNVRNEAELKRLIDSGLPMDLMKPFIGTRKKNKSFLNALHQHQLIATLGTLGNLDGQAQKRGFQLYDELLKDGVDCFATDYPLEVATHFYSSKE